jgi:hypothetical protein
MRNIIQYPITTQEILDTLQDIKDDLVKMYQETEMCGDMRACIVSEAIDRIKRFELLTANSEAVS